MTGVQWLDWSQARPPLDVVARTYGGVLRYVCSNQSEADRPGKRLTPAERDLIFAAGLDLALHGEDESDAAKGGYARGIVQGKQWGDYAESMLGWPYGAVIIAAVDYDTQGTFPAVIEDYLHGMTAGLAGRYRAGGYGSYWVIRGMMAYYPLACYVMTDAWGPDTPPPGTHLHQHGQVFGAGADVNDVLITPFGSYQQTLGGDDVTPADITALAKAIAREWWTYPTTNSVPSDGQVTSPAVLRFANGMQKLWINADQNDAILAALSKIVTNTTPPTP